ncbi:MAG: metallophosphoesterase [Eubacterium sp.]|nr:metallophosphoesterase [Eubacterium sp.]
MRIVHTADIHLLASPDAAYPWGPARKQAVQDTFARLIQETKRMKADLLLIAGDLFHRRPSFDDLNEINYLFRQIPETTVVLCAGNHDFISENSVYRAFPFAENVIGLWERVCTSVPVKGKDCRVYGLSYYAAQAPYNLYEGVKASGSERYHILLLHGGDAQHSPIDTVQLQSAGFDYIALGHIHMPGVLLPHLAAFPGSLEPLDPSETGQRGFIVCELPDTGKPSIEFVPFSSAVYTDMDLEIQADTSLYELKQKVREEAERLGKENIYTLRLSGSGRVFADLRPEIFRDEANIIAIADETLSDAYLEKLCAEEPDGVLAQFIKACRALAGPEKEAAMKEGVSAILAAAEKRRR